MLTDQNLKSRPLKSTYIVQKKLCKKGYNAFLGKQLGRVDCPLNFINELL